MRSGFVEPNQVLKEFVVKGLDIFKEQIFMELNEFFLNGSIKTFGVGIHFWAFRVGKPSHGAVI